MRLITDDYCLASLPQFESDTKIPNKDAKGVKHGMSSIAEFGMKTIERDSHLELGDEWINFNLKRNC